MRFSSHELQCAVHNDLKAGGQRFGDRACCMWSEDAFGRSLRGLSVESDSLPNVFGPERQPSARSAQAAPVWTMTLSPIVPHPRRGSGRSGRGGEIIRPRRLFLVILCCWAPIFFPSRFSQSNPNARMPGSEFSSRTLHHMQETSGRDSRGLLSEWQSWPGFLRSSGPIAPARTE